MTRPWNFGPTTFDRVILAPCIPPQPTDTTFVETQLAVSSE